MVVNTLVTGLIVFKILKVSLEVKAVTTSVERSLDTTGGTKLRHVIFIIIESGMALFAVQLGCFVLYILPLSSDSAIIVYDMFIVFYQIFNVIIIYKICSFLLCFTDKIYYLDRASCQQ
jgi:hypothetical protein